MNVSNIDESWNGPSIGVVSQQVARPLWSVMIPTFNCAQYLRVTLASVLAQNIPPEQMQIEVVDDVSTKDDPAAIVREMGQGRVAFFRKPVNEGATANFNTCIERSCGQLIHILHGDDYVLPGFYQRIAEVAEKHPDASLIASRHFFVDEHGVILQAGGRVRSLENVVRASEDFFDQNPLQFAGVAIRRTFYEAYGGFLTSLVHTADWEMWSRCFAIAGGIVLPDVLAAYRVFATNDTGRLMRTAENLRDIERLNVLFARRFPSFNRTRSLSIAFDRAEHQVATFVAKGDKEAAENNRSFMKAQWRKLSMWQRARKLLRSAFRRALHCYRAKSL